MNPHKHPNYGSTVEAIVYPFLLLAVLWVIYWGERLAPTYVHEWGILPQEVSGLKGILFAPLLHSARDFSHIINNSFPLAVLLGVLVYFYREVAAKVFFISWLIAGLFVWAFAKNEGSYHIGISGIVYALASFLFVSGTLRRYLPLQAISLFVVFMYGSMIWGIFPMEERVSWEGHLGGMLSGIVLAFLYRKKGPQRPKYRYEIEKELGIEPPDLEGEWLRKVEEQRMREEQLRLKQEIEAHNAKASENPVRIVYTYKPTEPKSDESDS